MTGRSREGTPSMSDEAPRSADDATGAHPAHAPDDASHRGAPPSDRAADGPASGAPVSPADRSAPETWAPPADRAPGDSTSDAWAPPAARASGDPAPNPWAPPADRVPGDSGPQLTLDKSAEHASGARTAPAQSPDPSPWAPPASHPGPRDTLAFGAPATPAPSSVHDQQTIT